MGAHPLDWAALLDGRDVRQWLVAMGALPFGSPGLPDSMVAALLSVVAAGLVGLPAGWCVWRGVGPQRPWYARRRRTSPPRVVWGGTLEQVVQRAAGYGEEPTR